MDNRCRYCFAPLAPKVGRLGILADRQPVACSPEHNARLIEVDAWVRDTRKAAVFGRKPRGYPLGTKAAKAIESARVESAVAVA